MRFHGGCENRRTPLCILLVTLISGFLFSIAGQASDFQSLSEKYFLDRTLDYARELLLKEEYLTVLYQSAAAEIESRKKEGFDASALNRSFLNLQPAHFDRDDPRIASASLAQRYRMWKDFEDREYQRRLQIVLDVRNALIESATPEQKHRQFRWELEKGLKYYGEEDWEIAALIFQRLLRDYDYRQLDDILFYLSEISIQLRHFDEALDYLLTLLSEYPESTYRAKSYDRAAELMFQMGENRDLIRLYQNYSYEGFPGNAAEMGGVHLLAARAQASFGHYQPAVEILERVDPDSPYYLASRYLLADCLAALKDWPGAIEVLTDMVNIKQGKMPYDRWRLLTDEARIKLAFIYYEDEDYDRAAELFDQVRQNSPFYDRVLMGKAWIAFQLDNYDETIAKTEELLSLYPASTEIYEAGSLAGYCYEQMGEKSTAMGYFYDVLEAGVGRSKLQTFAKEKERIRKALSELKALEEEVFSSGDEQAFSDYRRARNQLELCMRRIDLAELLEANVQMRSLVEERVLLDKLVRQHRELEPEVEQKADASAYVDFLALEDRIYTLMDHLNKVGIERLRSTPLYYKEARVAQINAAADSLSRQLETQIEALFADIREKQKQYEEARDAGDATRCVHLGLNLDRLRSLLERGEESRVMAEATRAPVLKTRVDRWSDFSFNRYAMGGMEFDELERKYERLKQVEGYIATLDDMIQQSTAGGDSSGATESTKQDSASVEGN